MLGSAVALLATRASQVYLQAQSERSEIEREMNKARRGYRGAGVIYIDFNG